MCYSTYFHSLQTITMVHRFEIENTITRRYSRFNAIGTQLIVRLLPPSNARDPVSHFLTRVNDLFEHALQNLSDTDMLGITIHNRVNQNDKQNGISFRHKDKKAGDVVCSVFEKVSQSNCRFNSLDTLVVTVHSVTMPVSFGSAIKSRGRQLSVMAQLKKRIVDVKATENCLAHALVIAIAKAENDPNYVAYRKGRKILPVVRNLLDTTGIDLSGGGGFPN